MTSCHKWCVEKVVITAGERAGRRIISRHKTKIAAERHMPSSAGWGGSGMVYRVRRLTKTERGLA